MVWIIPIVFLIRLLPKEVLDTIISDRRKEEKKKEEKQMSYVPRSVTDD